MNLTKLSRDRMMLSASQWSVPRDYFDPLYNYLVFGFLPGSFWSAVLANDFMRAIQHSHPGNDISSLKHAVGWIEDSFPPNSYGDYDSLQHWIRLEPMTRRLILEQCGLIYTEQEEIMRGLKGEKSHEPFLY